MYTKGTVLFVYFFVLYKGFTLTKAKKCGGKVGIVGFSSYLCRQRNKEDMKNEEKKLHIIEEECIGIASEPVGAAMRDDVSSMGYNIDNWPGMPFVGPDSVEEMNARIDQAEQEIDNGNGFSWEQVMLDAQSLVNRYATAVY